ncbi:formylglycine-generating enzyme family protein [Streptomyces sp. NPDC058595]|uniref:formylglycine-generating enzyme family protein n=1 Tax=Streptomyces sp. NPDC058595 TaxID=3346550 RepID=UPI00365D3CBF
MWLEPYLIDIYPTTNEDYARFVLATGHRPPQHWPAGRCPVNLTNHPVVWVTWHDANSYARWAGKSLPTSRQWEKAARGPRGRIYPWGSEPTAAKANTAEAGIDATTSVDRYQSGVALGAERLVRSSGRDYDAVSDVLGVRSQPVRREPAATWLLSRGRHPYPRSGAPRRFNLPPGLRQRNP